MYSYDFVNVSTFNKKDVHIAALKQISKYILKQS